MKPVFISYAWEPEAQRKLVHSVVDQLIARGVDCVIDHYDLRLGQDIGSFIQEIDGGRYSRVIVMCSKKYRERIDQTGTGVAREYSVYAKYLLKPDQEFVLPVLIEKVVDYRSILPPPLSEPIYIDLSENQTIAIANLASTLQGVRPRKPLASSLEAAVSYCLTNYSGIPLELESQIKETIGRYVVEECRRALDFVKNIGLWTEMSIEVDSITRVIEHAPLFLDFLPDPRHGIAFSESIWRLCDELGHNEKGLKVAKLGLTCCSKVPHIPSREFHQSLFRFFIAKSHHGLCQWQEAADGYVEFTEPNQLRSLPGELVFEAMVNLARCYFALNRFDECTATYRQVQRITQEHLLACEANPHYKGDPTWFRANLCLYIARINTANMEPDSGIADKLRSLAKKQLNEQPISQMSIPQKLRYGIDDPTDVHLRPLMFSVLVNL